MKQALYVIITIILTLKSGQIIKYEGDNYVFKNKSYGGFWGGNFNSLAIMNGYYDEVANFNWDEVKSVEKVKSEEVMQIDSKASSGKSNG